MTPGIYTDIEETAYHAIDAIGSTTIKKFHNNPSSILKPIEPSEDMNLGSAQDCYSLMGPEYFFKKFAIMPEFEGKKADRNIAEAEFELANMGKIILPATVTPKKIPTMKAISDVDEFLFKEHPAAKTILRTGEQQVSVFWDDEETGLLCKGRLDHRPDPATRSIWDLKKCGQIAKFKGQIRSLRYDLQAGHYTVGANANGFEIDGFGFIGFNFGDPPEVRIIMITGNGLTWAKDVAKTTVSLINECRQAGKYPKVKIPLNTLSVANLIGQKSNKQQLTPGDFVEEMSEPPYDWW